MIITFRACPFQSSYSTLSHIKMRCSLPLRLGHSNSVWELKEVLEECFLTQTILQNRKKKKYPFRDSRYKREKKQDGNNINKIRQPPLLLPEEKKEQRKRRAQLRMVNGKHRWRDLLTNKQRKSRDLKTWFSKWHKCALEDYGLFFPFSEKN